ncbi:hypothetical protein OCH239_18230 [Roseivivax halodurans JCM 10272]|uniref:Protein PsiE n=1 Tax=Roseivivax halodurans JCM 10272 TaxID=1449350 RepID=X7EJ72_9RHOB|nr:phosphate-starvation-inducible PsiE family protein [Roseivivax halodurans]ETX15216.1 hypothetical protein OCH239_18230 [Roseivivax halodurans JCM 10272]
MKAIIDAGYGIFARVVAFVLLLGTAAVSVVATASFVQLTYEVATGSIAEVPYSTLQQLFDLLLGAIIALELSHSVHLMVSGERGFAQVRTVLVIGILAVVRKFILIEMEGISGLVLLGLAAAVLALGSAYAMMVWLDRRGEGDRTL